MGPWVGPSIYFLYVRFFLLIFFPMNFPMNSPILVFAGWQASAKDIFLGRGHAGLGLQLRRSQDTHRRTVELLREAAGRERTRADRLEARLARLEQTLLRNENENVQVKS